MSHRFPFPGFARQFKTDLHILTDTGDYRQAKLTDRVVALDRIAGTSALICAAGMLAWLVATQSSLLDIPSAMAGSAYEATFGAPRADLIPADPQLAAKPLTERNVRLLQHKLKQLGFDPGPADGIAGGRTLDALNRYRATKDLDQVASIDRATAADLLD